MTAITITGPTYVLPSATDSTVFSCLVTGGIGQNATLTIGGFGYITQAVTDSPQTISFYFFRFSAKTYSITLTCTGTTVTQTASFTCYSTILVTCPRTGTSTGLWSDLWTITVYAGSANATAGINLYRGSSNPSVPNQYLMSIGLDGSGNLTWTARYFIASYAGSDNYIMTDPAFGLSHYFTILL